MLFLPTLVALRFVRVALSVCLSLIGYGSVTPNDLVKFVQSGRRRMRAIKYQGLRNIRLQQHEAEVRANTNGDQSKANGTLVQNLLANIMRGVCARRLIDDDAERVVVKRNSAGKSAVSLDCWRFWFWIFCLFWCSSTRSQLDVQTNKKAGTNKRTRPDDDDSDSGDDELKRLMEKSLDEESDSDDESYVCDDSKLYESESSSESSSENEEVVTIDDNVSEC